MSPSAASWRRAATDGARRIADTRTSSRSHSRVRRARRPRESSSVLRSVPRSLERWRAAPASRSAVLSAARASASSCSCGRFTSGGVGFGSGAGACGMSPSARRRASHSIAGAFDWRANACASSAACCASSAAASSSSRRRHSSCALASASVALSWAATRSASSRSASDVRAPSAFLIASSAAAAFDSGAPAHPSRLQVGHTSPAFSIFKASA